MCTLQCSSLSVTLYFVGVQHSCSCGLVTLKTSPAHRRPLQPPPGCLWCSSFLPQSRSHSHAQLYSTNQLFKVRNKRTSSSFSYVNLPVNTELYGACLQLFNCLVLSNGTCWDGSLQAEAAACIYLHMTVFTGRQWVLSV